MIQVITLRQRCDKPFPDLMLAPSLRHHMTSLHMYRTHYNSILETKYDSQRFTDIERCCICVHFFSTQILQYILIPVFARSFEKNEGEALIGGPPAPDQDSLDYNVISIFINKVIDPENPFGTSDAVRILLLQFSSLLVEQAAPHIHDAANK